MKLNNENVVFLTGRIAELMKTIGNLKSSPIHSPFNEFFLRDIFVEKYEIRLKRLKRSLRKILKEK